MLDLDDYQSRLQRKLQDVGEFLQPDDVDNFLTQSIIQYSKDRPLTKIFEITGDSSAFDFELPSDWVENSSSVKGQIEYPVDDTTQDQPLLEQADWAIIRKLVTGETVLRFRFKTFIPATGNKARFEYTTLHTLNETTSTIKDSDSQAILELAASLCFWALAARFAQQSDSTIDADVVDYARKSETYAELAKSAISNYRSLMGIGEEAKNSVAASAGIAIKELDIEGFAGGLVGDYLTHPSTIR